MSINQERIFNLLFSGSSFLSLDGDLLYLLKVVGDLLRFLELPLSLHLPRLSSKRRRWLLLLSLEERS